MSGIVFFTDIHFDNWSAFSRTTEGGFNSRFVEQLHYATEREYKVVFGGDLFNRRLLVPTDVLHKVYELFEAYDEVTQYFLVGNHDMYTWNTEHTPLALFENLQHVNIITQPTGVYFSHMVDIIFVPHGALIPTRPATDGYKILLTHYGVNEARLGPKDFRMKDDLTIKQLKDLNYDLVLLGHIHKPQALSDNIIVMGSPMAHSFHETNEEKYFYVFDCEKRELTKIPTNAPKFLTHEVRTKTELKKLKLSSTDYHRVNVLTPKITVSELTPHTGHNVIISRVGESTVGVEPSTRDEIRTPQEEINEYFDSYETELDKAKLKAMAMEVVNAY